MTKEAVLVEQPSPEPVADSGLALVVQRLAENPNVDVVKLEKIIELQERVLRQNAEAAFNAAFAQMQPEIPEIDERGKILVRDQLRSTYATLEDIHKVIKPILANHGFAIRHRTEWPADKPGTIRIVGILSHQQGHSEESTFEAPMDRSEYRTDIQSMGSTVSYGRRYTTLDLLNIATRRQDNDGQTAGRPEPPKGYAEWMDDLKSTADEGLPKLTSTWNKSRKEFRDYAARHDRDAWEALKQKAAKVTG